MSRILVAVLFLVAIVSFIVTVVEAIGSEVDQHQMMLTMLYLNISVTALILVRQREYHDK